MAYIPPNINGATTSAHSSPVVIATDQSAVHIKGTNSFTYSGTASFTTASLNSLSNSQTVGWQSLRISNLGTLANDYEISISTQMANTAPANDKSLYVYVVPWYTPNNGLTWNSSSGGTTTLPSGADAGYTIASPNNLRLLGVLNYTTQAQPLQDTFLLSNCFGNSLPDAWSLVLINYTGASLGSTPSIYYTPINNNLI